MVDVEVRRRAQFWRMEAGRVLVRVEAERRVAAGRLRRQLSLPSAVATVVEGALRTVAMADGDLGSGTRVGSMAEAGGEVDEKREKFSGKGKPLSKLVRDVVRARQCIHFSASLATRRANQLPRGHAKSPRTVCNTALGVLQYSSLDC
jgi:hypothetical protein